MRTIMPVWALPVMVNTTVTIFSELAPIVAPSIIWGIVAIACWQIVGIIGLRIAALARDKKLTASTYGLLRAAFGCLVWHIALATFAVVALTMMGCATPGAILGLFGTVLLALIAFGRVRLRS